MHKCPAALRQGYAPPLQQAFRAPRPSILPNTYRQALRQQLTVKAAKQPAERVKSTAARKPAPKGLGTDTASGSSSKVAPRGKKGTASSIGNKGSAGGSSGRMVFDDEEWPAYVSAMAADPSLQTVKNITDTLGKVCAHACIHLYSGPWTRVCMGCCAV